MMRRSPGAWLLAAASAVVLATVVASIIVMGGPSNQRDLRMDERRISDLTQLAALVEEFQRQQGRLPGALAELARPGLSPPLQDPASGEPYVYQPGTGSRYRLCAVFASDSSVAETAYMERRWAHGRGQTCFDLDAAPRGRAMEP